MFKETRNNPHYRKIELVNGIEGHDMGHGGSEFLQLAGCLGISRVGSEENDLSLVHLDLVIGAISRIFSGD